VGRIGEENDWGEEGGGEPEVLHGTKVDPSSLRQHEVEEILRDLEGLELVEYLL
jgi:hypothetical protein